jgi:hypothetical protein
MAPKSIPLITISPAATATPVVFVIAAELNVSELALAVTPVRLEEALIALALEIALADEFLKDVLSVTDALIANPLIERSPAAKTVDVVTALVLDAEVLVVPTVPSDAALALLIEILILSSELLPAPT